MTLFDHVFSGVFNLTSTIMNSFGYTMIHPIQFVLKIVFLYMALMNLLSFLLKAMNFAYWRLFQYLKYPMILISLVAHLSCTLGDLGEGMFVKLVMGVGSAAIVFVYLVDFAWIVGGEYINQKQNMNNIYLELILLGQFVLIGVAWFFLLKQHQINNLFYLYLFCLMIIMVLKRNVSIITSTIVVLFTIIQKYIILNGWTYLAIAFQIIMFYISMDRQGKQAGVQHMKKDDYPAKTYFFFACLQIHIYFLFDPSSIMFYQYITGAIYIITVINS